MSSITEFVERLRYAEAAVIWLIENGGSVDSHGLVYWACEVERLRSEAETTL
jgi:hypothetical protein